MMGGRFQKWVCDRCHVEGTSEAEARQHYGHPAGWKRAGNTHPWIDRWSPTHPDRENGFYWTVDGDAARRARAGSHRPGGRRKTEDRSRSTP